MKRRERQALADEVAARMLGLINDHPDPDRAPLATYRCVDSGTWHVGHDRRGARGDS